MRLELLSLLASTGLAVADVPEVPNSLSPDGKIHAVMDVDRDPKISPEWKGASFPQIEITQKDTGRVLASIGYFGSPSDDARPLREHVRVSWRLDSKAFGVTIDDRFYSSCVVYVLSAEGKFVPAPSLPTDYEKMTGFPAPDVKDLRPRERDKVVGWDEDGLLIYSIFRSPLHTFKGKDPLRHRVYLEVTPDSVTVVRVEHDEGEWRNGDWIPTKAEQDGTGQPATRPEFKSEGSDKPQPEAEGRSR
ncbi:MAG: hypothetical protein WD342_04985 [Verrucomicrobiales bacterium]